MLQRVCAQVVACAAPASPPHAPCTQAPDKPTVIEIEFEKGDPIAINGVKMSPATILAELNKLGGANGIGRIDLVESRFVGMKSRGAGADGPLLAGGVVRVGWLCGRALADAGL
jgi:hypothetical protein